MQARQDKFDLVDFVQAAQQAAVSWATALNATALTSLIGACGAKQPHVQVQGSLRLWVLSRDMVTFTLVVSEDVGNGSFLPKARLSIHAEIVNDHFCGWAIDEVQVASASYRALARYFEGKTSTKLVGVGQVVESDEAPAAPSDRRPVW